MSLQQLVTLLLEQECATSICEFSKYQECATSICEFLVYVPLKNIMQNLTQMLKYIFKGYMHNIHILFIQISISQWSK